MPATVSSVSVNNRRIGICAVRFAVYGPLDPDTVSGAQSLASKLFKLKRFADALPLYEEVSATSCLRRIFNWSMFK